MSQQNERMRPLSERMLRVLQLRESEKKTYEEIAAAIGCGAKHAAYQYRHARWLREYHARGEEGDPYYGLSCRAANCCQNADLKNREEIQAAFETGFLHPREQRDFGRITYREIAEWLGLPAPKTRPRLCPHCGGLV